jgi:hypothetical protein
MDDQAYDISHLLAQDAAASAAPNLRIVAAPPAAARPVPVTVADVASAQDQLARELLQNAAMHEALIQQYLRMAGDTSVDIPLRDRLAAGDAALGP